MERIAELAETRPEVLELTSVWDLFKVPGFYCDDLQPSLAQAQWALMKLKHANGRTSPSRG